MSSLDWIILVFYFAGIVFLGIWLGKRQKSSEDYFLGGRKQGSFLVASSLAANQVSAISLIGAPAFVALKPGGGLKWLQYEFAIPLAMIPIMVFLVPLYRKLSGASVYEYAERRFGLSVRLTLSAVFMLSRGLATGVALYAAALVLAVCLDLPLIATILIVGIIAILYTTIGGIMADIYSDVIQLFVLWFGTVLAIIISMRLSGGFSKIMPMISPERRMTIDFSHHGFGDGSTYSLLPMLIGAFFLYISYYGCDQSQAQRLLTTPDINTAQRSLMINGLIRFPIVLTYIIFGLLLAGILAGNPEWAKQVPTDDPDRLVPIFILEHFPKGIIGLVMAGIFAAVMSSVDSALNSLSAVTMTDFVARFKKSVQSDEKRFLSMSRNATAVWGIFCVISGILVARSSKTVIEVVNMIGSAFYGPILAVFILGVLVRKVDSKDVITGLIAGVITNVSFWLFAPKVSWLWWNPIGFFSTALVSILSGIMFNTKSDLDKTLWMLDFKGEKGKSWLFYLYDIKVLILILMFILILGITYVIG